MSRLSIANLKKTIYYLKRNGLRDTYLAALERLRKKEQYTYCPPDEKALLLQKEQASLMQGPFFSILVPAYRTSPDYLRAMIDSVLVQSYEKFELIIVDASEDAALEGVLQEYHDERIKYRRLSQNNGISENTNEALRMASGDYIGLLDHDDLLTPDALYENAAAIQKARESGTVLKLLYSDEDKCDEFGKYYYEPHNKTKFNLDLILSNNYICHFTVMEAGLIKELGFRREYDGAQDYDLILRGVQKILCKEEETAIFHIPRVLYHWRCHRGSTAENPQSKQYAYEAGERALQDFWNRAGIRGKVSPAKHLGFYQTEYQPDILSARKDIGAIGGRLLDGKNKITGGIYTKEGICPYEKLRDGFSGYMHRAALMQEAEAVDIRLMQVSPALVLEVRSILKELTGENREFVDAKTGRVDAEGLALTEEEYRRLSIQLCGKIRGRGYRVLWNPEWKAGKKQVEP